MTLLELVNFVRREAGASGGPLSALTGTQSEETTNYINWIVNSWNDIQRLYGTTAKFMRSDFTLALQANQWSYPTSDPNFTFDSKGGVRTFKIDSLRAALDTVIRARLRVYYAADGQRVPEDLHLAEARGLVDAALRAPPEQHPFASPDADFPLELPSAAAYASTKTANGDGGAIHG